jgi:hypothetical protein
MEAESGLRRLPRNGRSAAVGPRAPRRNPAGTGREFAGPRRAGSAHCLLNTTRPGSLRHIMERRTGRALSFTGLDQQSFARNGWARDAVERCVERPCRARAKPLSGLASKRTTSCRASPGPISAAMGNRLRHAYDRWTLISFGGQRRTACLTWPPQRDRRWRNSKTAGLTV